jgi:predicted GIY-YIG superfamily endonuclease
MYFVYFLKSRKHPNWVYVGYTNNIKRRISEHKEGLNISTRPYVPLMLISYITTAKEEKAKEIERYFKGGSGKAVLKKRILTDEALA